MSRRDKLVYVWEMFALPVLFLAAIGVAGWAYSLVAAVQS